MSSVGSSSGSSSNRSSTSSSSSSSGSSSPVSSSNKTDKTTPTPKATVSPQVSRYASAFKPSATPPVVLDAPAGPAPGLKPDATVPLEKLKPLLDRTPLATQKTPLHFEPPAAGSPELRAMMGPTTAAPATTFSKTPSTLPTSSFQKPPATVAPPAFNLGDRLAPTRDGYPVYAQGSGMPWAQDKMAPTSNSMAGYGCAVSSTAMAISGITGKTITPGELNAHLSQPNVGGYDRSGNVSWPRMGNVAGLDVQVTRQAPNTFNADRIDAELAQGRPVVAQVDYKVARNSPGYDGRGDHWILVTGRDANGQYQANDPAGGRMITLHRNDEGQLTANELPPGAAYTEPYVTTGNATTFDAGAPAAHAGTVTEGGAVAPVPMPPLDRTNLGLNPS